jgi:serine/threonine protein phosphatase PrpC
MRVAGSLSVTRAFGDAYLKSDQSSFFPFKNHAPYITACPEISVREIVGSDRFIILGTDGVWEKVDATVVSKWVTKYFHLVATKSQSGDDDQHLDEKIIPRPKRKWGPLSPAFTGGRANTLSKSNVSDVICWKILNNVRRTRKMKNLKSLMAFPPGRARRLRHDDITVCVVNLSGFVDFDD